MRIDINNLKELKVNKKLILDWYKIEKLSIFVIFHVRGISYKYVARNTFLFTKNRLNVTIIDLLNNTKEDRYDFISNIVGYRCENGGFPEFRDRDGKALYKILLKFYSLLNKKYSNSYIYIKRNKKNKTKVCLP